MEFRPGSPERRPKRRICPSCQVLCGAQERCARCGKATEARIQLTWYVGGKRHRELTQCWREPDAALVLQRKEADYWRQQELGVERDVGGSLRDAVDAFLRQQAEHSANYRKQLRTALSALGEGLGWDREVHAITAQEIAQFKEDGLSALSPASVRSYMLVLRRFFAYLHQEGWIRRNPTVKVKLPAATRRKDCLRPEEVRPVLDAFWRVAPALAPIATACVLGGWRKGEILNLRRKDVDLAGRWAYVLDFEGDELTEEWSPKTDSSYRAVPLHALTVRALERVEPVTRPDGSASPWMFPIVDPRKRRRYRDKRGRMQPVMGDRRSPSTTFFGEKLREALTAAGIERRVTVHGLRRTFAVLMQEAGAPDSIIRQAIGHGARGVTELHYLPRHDPLIQQWVDRIELGASSVRAPEPNAGEKSAPYLPPVATEPSALPPIRHQSVANRPPYLRLVD